MLEPYVIIRDTREQNGWDFTPGNSCAGVVEGTLKTGDYTVDGHELALCIERKGSVAEFAKNVTQKRFTNELERMRAYPWKYIILEFDMQDLLQYPKGAGLPPRAKRQIRINGWFLLKRTIELMQEYKVPILFCGDRGKDVCSSIIKRFLEKQQQYEK